MFEEFISGALGLIWSLAGAAVIAVCGFGAKRLNTARKEHTQLVAHLKEAEELKALIMELKEQNKAQSEALREIMGDYLDQEYKRLVDQGYASPEEKVRYEKKYRAYHANGGNGTRTAHFEDVMDMNAYPTD